MWVLNPPVPHLRWREFLSKVKDPLWSTLHMWLGLLKYECLVRDACYCFCGLKGSGAWWSGRHWFLTSTAKLGMSITQLQMSSGHWLFYSRRNSGEMWIPSGSITRHQDCLPVVKVYQSGKKLLPWALECSSIPELLWDSLCLLTSHISWTSSWPKALLIG